MQEFSTFINQHPSLSMAIFAVILILVIVETLRAKRNTFHINPLQLTQLINKKNATVLDLRGNDAWRQGHIIGAQAITAQDIQNHPKKIEKFKQKPVVVVANAPTESQKITVLLLKQGYTAYSLSGGIKAWTEAQMPLVKEQK